MMVLSQLIQNQTRITLRHLVHSVTSLRNYDVKYFNAVQIGKI